MIMSGQGGWTAVYKYVLHAEITDLPQTHVLHVLSAGVQGDDLVVWAAVRPAPDNKPPLLHRIGVFGTGHPLPVADARFINTVQLPSGLVFHVFELF